PDCHFDLIGINGGTFDTLPRNVEVHSSLNRLDYERLLSRADAGIGSLALHRLGLTEACPLKTREYLAYGLPVIIGYKDSDFPSGAPFVLQLDTRHRVRPPHVEAGYSFLHHWNGRRVTRDMVHHLDIAHKEIQRIAFFEGVAGSWGKPRVS
ncbi:MAG: hypothetical protein N2438_10690, partial [Limisphaera sp.]|nr:hypothetical protein [Limisphaera sp.]